MACSGLLEPSGATSSSRSSSGGGSCPASGLDLGRLAARTAATKVALTRPAPGSSQTSWSCWRSSTLRTPTPSIASMGPSPPATHPGWNHLRPRWSLALLTRTCPTSNGPRQALEQQDWAQANRLTSTAQVAVRAPATGPSAPRGASGTAAGISGTRSVAITTSKAAATGTAAETEAAWAPEPDEPGAPPASSGATPGPPLGLSKDPREPL